MINTSAAILCESRRSGGVEKEKPNQRKDSKMKPGFDVCWLLEKYDFLMVGSPMESSFLPSKVYISTINTNHNFIMFASTGI